MTSAFRLVIPSLLHRFRCEGLWIQWWWFFAVMAALISGGILNRRLKYSGWLLLPSTPAKLYWFDFTKNIVNVDPARHFHYKIVSILLFSAFGIKPVSVRLPPPSEKTFDHIFWYAKKVFKEETWFNLFRDISFFWKEADHLTCFTESIAATVAVPALCTAI
jgi:hypothetical protein